ncbi:MMPL family transporter [Pseudonocardia lacus]|uniref:MMPL family transporter n=1 Tax=Pseudonocardia lacus TaxID=2835865 RepID=UPI001BDD2065|nr:MMPL family transporter [Pseudonocardia lacus]
MSSLLYALGRAAYRGRGKVVLAWIAVLALCGIGAGTLGAGLDNAITIPGTESQRALDQLSGTFPQVSGATAEIVIVADDVSAQPVREPVEAAADELDDVADVAAVVSPYAADLGGPVSDDGRAAILRIQFEGQRADLAPETLTTVEDIADRLAAALPAGDRAVLGGQLYSQELPALSLIELVGVVVALIVLVVTFGSLLAAGMPLLIALVGVGVSTLLIFFATAFGSVNSTTPLLSLMLGLAVGIDYALFVIARHQDQLADGMDPEESTAQAVATAGSAVVFAGITVIIALVGLSVAGIPFLTVMGVAAAVGVAIAVAVSLTLLPALLGFAGGRVLPRRRRADGPRRENRFFAGWVRLTTRFPIPTIVAVLAVVGVLALPATSLRLALPDAGGLPDDEPARVAYDLVAEHFGPGHNGPLIVTGTIVESTDPLGLMDDLADEIRALPGVADVPLATPNETADTGIVQVVPTGAPDSAETEALVAEIRGLHDRILDEYGVDISVTGFTAVGIDVSEQLGDALLPFGILVVGLSLVLLTVVFRSVAVPVKAAVGYLFSVAASFGVVALVFEHGWFADVLGVSTTGPVISFMPIILMGVLFGLAMDYEVFLVARIREDFVHSGPTGAHARGAIGSGFRASAKVVTAAALIMFAVFVAFVPEGDVNIKPIALGLATGVFVDAFLVRMTLVPAVLALLGKAAWWLPAWLDRRLPRLDVEGEGVQREIALRDWEAGAAVAADAVALPPLLDDLTVTVPDGESLLVSGPRAEVSAALLALSGRLAPSGGRLKVLGKVLPDRAGAVRARSGYLDLRATDDPSGALRAALAEKPALLAVDGLDAAGDDVRVLLAGVRHTLLVGTTADDDPFPAARRLALEPGRTHSQIEVPA